MKTVKGEQTMKRTILILAVAALGTQAFAWEKTVDLKYQGLGAGRSQQIQFNGHKSNVAANQQNFKLSKATLQSGLTPYNNTTQTVYCVDLSQYTDTKNTNKYEVVTLDGLEALKNASNKNLKIEGLYKLIRSSSASGMGNAFSTKNNDYAAAFQLITWDVLYDFDGTAGSIDIAKGKFQVGVPMSSAVTHHYNSLKTGLLNEKNGAAISGIYGLRNDCHQDYIMAVPEPGTMFGLAMGAAAMLRKRAKKNAK
jgi:hypothetical protein